MRLITNTIIYVGLAIGSGVTACSEKPFPQAQNTTEASIETLWQIPDDQANRQLISAPEMERRSRMIDYEIEKLNRLIEYQADENIDRWEEQKETLQKYKRQLRSATRSAEK